MICDSILHDWYTGFSSAGSRSIVHNTKILDNTNDMCADLLADVYLFDNCIEDNSNIGIRIHWSLVNLGNYVYGVPGGNRIINNDSVQCKVMDGGVLCGGEYPMPGSPSGGENHISADAPDKLRIVAQDISWGLVQNEYWGGKRDHSGRYERGS